MFQTTKHVSLAIGLACTLFTIASVRPAEATPILVTSRAALGANDFFDWGTLGPVLTHINSPFNSTTNSGLSFTGSQVAGNFFQRYDQSASNWGGNFFPGDHLIIAQGFEVPMSLTLDFASLVRGGGAQIQFNGLGAFTAHLAALDGAGNTLATLTEVGNSTTAGDGSAIFIGALDTSATIDKLVFTIDRPQADFGFLINTVSVRTETIQGPAPGPAPVPEPATLTLVGLGVGASFLWRRKR